MMMESKEHPATAPQTQPAGESPTGSAPEPAPRPAPGPTKVRRVGTFSLGIMLVAVGTILLASIFLPNLDLVGILKFAPVILVALGIEVLLYAARPDVKIKYDGVSILLAVLLMLACGASGVFSWFVQSYNPETISSHRAAARELEERAEQVLDTVPNARAAIRDYSIYQDSCVEFGQVLDTGDTSLYVTMNFGAQSTAEEFTRDCKAVVDACRAGGLEVDSYQFDVWQGSLDQYEGELWELSLDRWSAGADEATLRNRVVTTYYYDGNSFDTAEGALNFKQERRAQQLYDLYINTFDSDPDVDFEEKYGDSPTEEQRNDFMSRRLTQYGVSTAETAQSRTEITGEE